jgi:hypothetical protein
VQRAEESAVRVDCSPSVQPPRSGSSFLFAPTAQGGSNTDAVSGGCTQPESAAPINLNVSLMNQNFGFSKGWEHGATGCTDNVAQSM